MEKLLYEERPWGSWRILDEGEGFKIKRLEVKPGKRLSLQLHHRRSEHWVVAAGTATVTVGDEIITAKQNEHIFIPVEAAHRLENKGEELVTVIEVQVGDYLEEDDLVRLEDDFGRAGKQELTNE
ncbi:MAG: phosphomannose isomerase type II C-terminal cupin domain [bacterium]